MMGYSREQLNYFRLCHVAFNLVPVGLRQIFKNEWDFRYKTTFGEWKDIPQNGLDFYSNESRGSRTRNRRCLATIQNGNTAEWDCTCLFFAILYSDSIGTTLSLAVNKDVDDIRQVRNDIAHIRETELTDADVRTYVGKVLNAFISLGLPIKDIEDVKNQTSFSTYEVENLKEQVRDLQTELDKSKSELGQKNSELGQKNSELGQKNSELGQKNSELGQKKSELNQTESDLEETKSTLQSTDDLISAKEENKTITRKISCKLEPFCILTLTPPHEIIRRSDDIERITNKMQELYNGANGAVSTMYLSGNPGCGKSELARQLGHELFSKRTDNIDDLIFVATLNAESIETLTDSFITLGRHLGITEYALISLESSKREKPSETIQQLHRLVLPKVRTYTRWMIIADNVIDLGLVRGFLPQTGSEEWGHGQVLITTQDSATIPPNAPHTYHESFSKGMKPDEAVKLLGKVSQIDDLEQGGKVAEVLDYQPLALAAAAHYVQTVVKNGAPNYSWTQYLEVLTQLSQREATENILASNSLAYSKTTTTAVKMALQRAVENDEILCQTFSFLALCASELIPLEAVMKFVKARIMDQPDELIKEKILISPLILVLTEEKQERKYFRLHNIVHMVLKHGDICNRESTEKDHNMAEAVKIFKSLLELNEENYPLLNKLTPHCKSLLAHMTSNFTLAESTFLKMLTPFITFDEVIGWLDSVANACRELSDLSSAKDMVDLACSLLQNIHGTDAGASVIKASIFNTSGMVYDDIREHSQAKELYEKALMIQKKISGEEHADVAASYNNLAVVYNNIGEYNQAKELHEKSLMIRKKIFGEEHADVAASYNNLAMVYDSIGEYNQAKELHEKALMIQKKIFGEEHADVAASYNNLAGVYYNIGEYNQAKELYEKALIIQKKIFGEEHADVVTTGNNLATVNDCIAGSMDNHAKVL